MVGWHKLSLISASMLIGVSLSVGCGGRSEDSKGSGGTAGSGGQPQTKGGRSGATGGSSDGGRSANGGSMTAGGSMAAGGSAQGGSEGCVYGGEMYAFGESFKAGDGCNTCTCFGPNDVACTLIDCPDPCQSTQSAYITAIEDAKRCNPAISSEQCTTLQPSTLACTCVTFVNPANSDATKRLAELQGIYSQNGCGANVTCADCASPHHGYCSAAGRCEDRVTTGTASCLVNGTVYPHGATGIQDPFSCNHCTCFDGQLGCTEIGCGTPCPPDTVPGSRCVECNRPGPGGCIVVETGCVAPCDRSCPDGGHCIDGTCQLTCPPLPI